MWFLISAGLVILSIVMFLAAFANTEYTTGRALWWAKYATFGSFAFGLAGVTTLIYALISILL